MLFCQTLSTRSDWRIRQNHLVYRLRALTGHLQMNSFVKFRRNEREEKCYVLAENEDVTDRLWSWMVVPFGQQILGLWWLIQLGKLPTIVRILSMRGTSYPNGLGLCSSMQIPSGYYLQTMNSNLHFSGFVLPVAAMNVVSIVPLLILVPILDCINSYLFTSKATGHSPTIYISEYKIYVGLQWFHIYILFGFKNLQ